MPEFWSRHEDITVDQLISDDSREYRRVEVELRIRYGFGSWPDENVEFLFDDTIFPVCGPAFAQRHSGADATMLSKLPLLNVDWVDLDWIGWDEVLRRAKVVHGPLRGRRFGKFFVAMQAAQANQGVAVGWHRLSRRLIDEGKARQIYRAGDPSAWRLLHDVVQQPYAVPRGRTAERLFAGSGGTGTLDCCERSMNAAKQLQIDSPRHAIIVRNISPPLSIPVFV